MIYRKIRLSKHEIRAAVDFARPLTPGLPSPAGKTLEPNREEAMPKKQKKFRDAGTDPAAPSNDPKFRPAGAEGWDSSEVVHARTPSGTRLILASDEDCILKFIERRDISDKMKGDIDEPVYYYIFEDGARVVSLPASYAMAEAKLEKDYWYYICNQGAVEMTGGKNPMKDFLILRLGVDGQQIKCPVRVSEQKILILTGEIVAEVNYHRLNYPLRQNPKISAVKPA